LTTKTVLKRIVYKEQDSLNNKLYTTVTILVSTLFLPKVPK